MSAVTVVGTLDPDPRRGLGRHGLRPALPAGRAGDLRHLRELDLDAVGGARPSARRSRRMCSSAPPSWRGVWACLSAPAAALCASKIPDAQAAHESCATRSWPTLLGGVNFVLHAAGWLEGGLVLVVREIHHRCRSARHVPALRRGHRLVGERPGALCHPRGRARGAISSAAPIPRPISRPRSGAPPSPTTIPSSNGATTARRNARARQRHVEAHAPRL